VSNEKIQQDAVFKVQQAHTLAVHVNKYKYKNSKLPIISEELTIRLHHAMDVGITPMLFSRSTGHYSTWLKCRLNRVKPIVSYTLIQTNKSTGFRSNCTVLLRAVMARSAAEVNHCPSVIINIKATH
jgi:hypothetical protein